jgi:hypothetical protein
MKIFIPFFLISIFSCTVQAQTDSLKKNPFRTVLRLNSSPIYISGQFYEATVSSFFFLEKNKKKETAELSRYSFLSFPVSEVDKIRIYRNGNGGKGAFAGFLIGAATGVLIGLISGNDPPGFFSFTAWEKAEGAGLALGTFGGLIGAITGSSAEVKIPIGGKQEIYKRHTVILKNYSVIK